MRMRMAQYHEMKLKEEHLAASLEAEKRQVEARQKVEVAQLEMDHANQVAEAHARCVRRRWPNARS